MKINVLTRVHLAHAEFLETWISSILNNKEYIEIVIFWLSDKETSNWFTEIYPKLSKLNIPLRPITNFQSDPITCLSYINDPNLKIGAVLDFDDIWLPNHLELAISETNHFTHKSFYAGCSEFVDKDVKISLGTNMLPCHYSDILLHTPIAFSAMVWKPGSVNVNLGYNRMIDQSLAYFAFKNNRVQVGSVISVKIRKHKTAMSSQLFYQFLDRIRFFILSRNPLILLNTIFVILKKIRRLREKGILTFN